MARLDSLSVRIRGCHGRERSRLAVVRSQSDAGSGRNRTSDARTSDARASDARTSAIFLQVLDFARRPECGGERGNAYIESVDHRRMLVDSGQQCVVDHRDV